MNARGGYGRWRKATAHGRGGISLVAPASGVSRRAIAVGLAELQKKPDRSQRSRRLIRQRAAPEEGSAQGSRVAAGSGKTAGTGDVRGPAVPAAVDKQSVRNLADELRAQGHEVGHMLVAELLHEQMYSLQANRKTREGSSHRTAMRN